jgi:hypothetical protein
MIFSGEFIDSLPEDTLEALKKIEEHFNNWMESKGKGSHGERRHNFDVVEAYSFLVVYFESMDLQEILPDLNDTDDGPNIGLIYGVFDETIPGIIEELENEINVNTFNNSKPRFAAKFGKGFVYEFSEDDFKKVQLSINELRDLIFDSEIIEDNHKQRLLKRLERLQSELHKKMSNLDGFWGFVGEAGVVMGKFGKDVKPLTDRIKDVMNIVWRTQARAEELESGAPNPFLRASNDEDE